MINQNFRARFCEKFGCPESEYENKALQECLYPHAKLFAPIIRIFKRDLFAVDLEFLRALGEKSTRWEAQGHLLSFQSFNREDTYLRRKLKIRVSGQKAAILAAELIPKEA